MKNRFPIFNSGVFIFMALFVVSALSLDFVWSKWVLMKSELSNERKLDRLLNHHDPNEIPVFGSSKARSAFIPDSLGNDFYNYGMEKCGFDVINFLLEVELSKDKESPIFIEYNHRSFIKAPEHTINMATYLPHLANKKVMDFLQKNDRMEFRYRIPGLRYYGSYFYYFRYYMKQSTGSRKIVSKGGNFADVTLSKEVFGTLVSNRMQMMNRLDELQLAINDHTQAVSASQRRELEYLKNFLWFTYDPDLVEAFEELVKSHPERRVYLVYTPQHWSELKGIANLNEMQAFFKSMEQGIENLEVIDLSNMELPDNGFKNTSHLNLLGARRFSSSLRDRLTQ